MAHESKSHETDANGTNIPKPSDKKDMRSKRRKGKGEGNPLPMASSNFLSILTYSWLSGLMWQLYKKGAASITWWTCPDSDSAEVNMERLERIWDAEVKLKGIRKASFQRTLLRFLRTRLLVSSFIFLVRVGFFISGPAFAVLYLLRELSKDDVDVPFAVGMVVLLTCTETSRSVLLALAYNYNFVAAMRVRSGLLAFLYKRILKLRSLQDRTVGELVNLVSNDSQRIYDSVVTGPFLIGVPFLLVFGMVYTSVLVGPYSLIGCLVFVLYQIFLFINSQYQLKFRRQAITVTDQRVRIMNELLTFVQLVKMYVWEDSFADTVADVRDYERRILQKSAYFQYSSTSMTPLVPSLAGVFTILAFILTENNLTAAEAFTLISVFNVMVIALNKVQSSFKLLAEAYVGAERMKTLLVLPQMKAQAIDPCERESDAVVFTNASLAWNEADPMQFSSPAMKVVSENPETEGERMLLKNIDLQVSKGDLVGICGTVGCGKTSLLEAILGRMIITKGKVTAGGKVAYACQQAWIMNDTARENILFGQEYDEEKYNKVVEACCLKSDFEILSAGDQTEIGERGMNISGGQKQRLSLARAVYTGRDICLFDDPLSAVDAHVGKHIFKHCIQEHLKGKTVLFVTHQLQYLTHCKLVLFMKDGTIAETGTHQELMDRGGEYAQLLKIHHDSRKSQHKHQRHTPVHTPVSRSPKEEFRRRSSTLQGDSPEYISEPPTDEIMNKFITNIRERSRSLSISERKKALRTDITRQNHGSPRRSFSKADDKNLLINGSAAETNVGIINPAYTKSDEGSLGESSHEKKTTSEKGLVDISSRVPIDGNVIVTTGFSDVHLDEDSISSSSVEEDDDDTTEKDKKKPGSSLMSKEETESAAGWEAYKGFIKAAGGYLIYMGVILSFSMTVAADLVSKWWLSHWLNAGDGDLTIENEYNVSDEVRDVALNPTVDFYAYVYGGLAGIVIIMAITRTIAFVKTSLRASTKLHDQLYRKISRCPMSFFNTTPVGRILNRFSADMDEVDVRLPEQMEQMMYNVIQILGSIAMMAFTLPYLLVMVAPLTIMFVVQYKIFSTGVRQLKVKESVTRSPILSHLTTSVQGLTTINAFNMADEFIYKFQDVVDDNAVAKYLYSCTNRWLALRLDFISIVLETTTGFLAVFLRSQITPALAGLAMSLGIQITGKFQFTVRTLVEVDAKFTSVERLRNYTVNTPSEETAEEMDIPPDNWPTLGTIRFTNYHMKYLAHLPFALKNVNFQVKPREKIGIAGRTGSGKTSLIQALFRLVEPASGSIIIDGIDISTLSLRDLRRKFAIIPQEPVLFVGTIRYNLDPFDEYSDEYLWEALERCHVKNSILALEEGLDSEVVENGANFSSGEKQLLCMARALLKKSKILILDEATAAIDSATDALIQTTIKEAFSQCTILIIAHRLNTILHCDRILVMRTGEIIEFDSPANLLADPNSAFKAMLIAS